MLVDVSLYLVSWVTLPYFLITAGYFLGKSVRTNGQPIAYLRRYASSLVGIFVAWFCIYVVIPRNWPAAVREYGVWQALYLEASTNLHLLATEHIRLFWRTSLVASLVSSRNHIQSRHLDTARGLPAAEVCGPLIVGLYGLALTQEVSISDVIHSSYDASLWSYSCSLQPLDGGWQDVGSHPRLRHCV